jgi:hypothetical protein
MAILSSLVEPRKDGTVEPALAVALLPWKGHDEDWTDMSETAGSEGASTSAMETQDRLLHAIEEVQVRPPFYLLIPYPPAKQPPARGPHTHPRRPGHRPQDVRSVSAHGPRPRRRPVAKQQARGEGRRGQP